MRAADTCLLVLNAHHGVEVGTELVWRELDKKKMPTLIAVNQLDHENANFSQAVEQAKTRLGNQVTLMQYPYNPGTGFDSIIDLLKMTMYKFKLDGGKPDKLPIPEDQKEIADELHNRLVEVAAENDDTLMNLYFEKGSLDEDELRKGLKIGILKRNVYPVFCVSAKQNMGSGRIMGFIDNVCPGSEDAAPEITTEGKEIKPDPKGQTVLFVYKTAVEQHLGLVSYFKVISGTLVTAQDLTVARSGNTERSGHLFIVDGKKKVQVEKLVAGDLGVTVKLKDVQTNDTLFGKGAPVELIPMEYPAPKIEEAIYPKDKKDDEKLGQALHELAKEDPTLYARWSGELRQNLVEGQGELHLAVAKWRLEHEYKIQVEYTRPRVPYRETIMGTAVADYRHKKQSGGSGQFGEIHIQIDPWVEGMPDPSYNVRDRSITNLPWGGQLAFFNCIVGGVIDTRFIPSVEKGVMEKMKTGPLTGSHVRDVRVSLFDGKMHPVDSNDISFQIAATMAFKDAFGKAKPRLMEPIFELEVLTPDDVIGEIISDLNTRRAIILGMDSEGPYQKVIARVPLSELYRYSTVLRSITRGRALFSRKFIEYAIVPEEIKQKLIEEHKQAELTMAH